MQCIEEGLTWATLSRVGRSENSTIGREAMLRALKKNEAEKEWIRSNCVSEIVHSAELDALRHHRLTKIDYVWSGS
jgi:hypothetical protein